MYAIPVHFLGIETSCDETAAAVVEDGTVVKSSVTATTKDVFSDFGGVIPEEAARRQVECMNPVLRTALAEAECDIDEIDAIAVTRGPGLLGSLLVGTTAARTIASLWGKPIVGVHHTLGHLSSVWLELPDHQLPVIALSASGGHTDLWFRATHTRGVLLGSTRDDAAGEAFDKGAAMLGLRYPGGPAIQEAAKGGDDRAFPFPLPLHSEDTMDFSFSGLKTALKYAIRGVPTPGAKRPIPDFAASFQRAICAHLCDRIARAIKAHPDVKEVHLVGGVSANTRLRKMATEICSGIPVFTPKKISYCTDNAAMIAAAGYFMAQELGDDAFTPFDTVASIPLRTIVSAVKTSSTKMR